MPAWILALAYWLHMCATVVCVGGLFFYAVLLVPALDSIPLEAHPALMEKLRYRFQPLA